MSHFTKMEVNYSQKYEAELLLAIEEAMGAKPEVHAEPVELLNYWGETTSDKTAKSDHAEKCHLVLRRGQGKLASRATNDIGWRRTEDGGYAAYLDDKGITTGETGLISQSYAVAVAEKQVKAKGYTVSKKALSDGRIQLTATKY